MRRWWRELCDEAHYGWYNQPGWDCNEEDEVYQVDAEPYFICFLRVLGCRIAEFWWKYIQKCEHDGCWVSEDYCGTNSGAMGDYCRRCGYSFWTQLY